VTPSIALIETYVWFSAGPMPLELAIQLTPERLHKLWHRTTNWRAMLRILLVTRLPLARLAVVEAVALALEKEPRVSNPIDAQGSLSLLRMRAAELSVGIPLQRASEVVTARAFANSQASFDARFRKLTNSGLVWDAIYDALRSLLESDDLVFGQPKYAADRAMCAAEKAGVTGGEILHWLRPLGPPTLEEIVAASFQGI